MHDAYTAHVMLCVIYASPWPSVYMLCCNSQVLST